MKVLLYLLFISVLDIFEISKKKNVSHFVPLWKCAELFPAPWLRTTDLNLWYSTAILDHLNFSSLSACFHKATNMATTATPATTDTETNAKHSANATTQVSLEDMLKEIMRSIE